MSWAPGRTAAPPTLPSMVWSGLPISKDWIGPLKDFIGFLKDFIGFDTFRKDLIGLLTDLKAHTHRGRRRDP